MAAMNIRTTVPVGLLPGSSGVLGVGDAGSAVTPVGDFTPATSGAGILVGLQPSHRSDISGLKPDAQTPSAHCEIVRAAHPAADVREQYQLWSSLLPLSIISPGLEDIAADSLAANADHISEPSPRSCGA
ncbi:uncharacterized protein LOC124787814 isoform X2 [Schistocerca piceifrons]|uniref:uncharacterized protein LOC124787814 isoform X2 n=1 Tax=Schistocerca piceifrons TaxID=274613 RepID=UPI001F5ED14D|nr:uncharacterized protein LOC124787814 isoform X2 [Schistocerca piceifrons]